MTDLIGRFERPTFVGGFKPGKGRHITVVAPTGGGKTRLMSQLLVAQPSNQLTIVLDTKPRNSELDKQFEGHDFKVVYSFPPVFPSIAFRRHRRWIIRMEHTGNPDVDRETLTAMTVTIIQWAYLNAYKYGGARIVIDEALDFIRAGLGGHLEMLWTHGRSQDVGLWLGSQRPRDIPLYAYSMCTDLFAGYNPDMEDQKRISQMGGYNPKTIISIIDTLNEFEFLYLCRRPRAGCVILP